MTRITRDFAHISLVAGDNFYEIAQVKAEGREENLKLAIEAYQRALSFYTLDRFSVHYAATQNNLGNAYGGLAEVRDKEANLSRAIQAYQEALKVRTLSAFPMDYGSTNFNLGRIHWLQAEAAGADTERKTLALAQAKAAFEESVRAFAQERAQPWLNRAQEALASIQKA